MNEIEDLTVEEYEEALRFARATVRELAREVRELKGVEPADGHLFLGDRS